MDLLEDVLRTEALEGNLFADATCTGSVLMRVISFAPQPSFIVPMRPKRGVS